MGGEVTRDEFEALKIRVTVMENAVSQVFKELALIREELNERFDSVDRRLDRQERVFLDLATEMRRQLTEFQANMVAAVVTSKKPPGES